MLVLIKKDKDTFEYIKAIDVDGSPKIGGNNGKICNSWADIMNHIDSANSYYNSYDDAIDELAGLAFEEGWDAIPDYDNISLFVEDWQVCEAINGSVTLIDDDILNLLYYEDHKKYETYAIYDKSNNEIWSKSNSPFNLRQQILNNPDGLRGITVELIAYDDNDEVITLEKEEDFLSGTEYYYNERF